MTAAKNGRVSSVSFAEATEGRRVQGMTGKKGLHKWRAGNDIGRRRNSGIWNDGNRVVSSCDGAKCGRPKTVAFTGGGGHSFRMSECVAVLSSPDDVASWRAGPGNGAKDVGVIVGAFDMMQPGNIAAICSAAGRTGRVCVVVEPDSVVAARGGTDRPFRGLRERMELVGHLRGVSAVTSFSAEDTEQFMKMLRPYSLIDCSGCAGGGVAGTADELADDRFDLPLLPGCSTSEIAEAIRENRTPVTLPTGSKVGAAADVCATGEKHVTVNGCFDVLHIAHLRFLAAARGMGDMLTVLINDDASVRGYKGPDRPVFPQSFRRRALLALRSVSAARVFSEDNPLRVLEELKPDIHVKGGTFEEDRTRQERELVESWGGRVEFCPMVEGYSTTDIIERIMR